MRTKKLCSCGHDVFNISDRYPIEHEVYWDDEEENFYAVEIDPPNFPPQDNVLVKCAKCGEEQDILPLFD